MGSRKAIIALNVIEGAGLVCASLLLEHFGNAPRILNATKSALLRVRNIGDEVAVELKCIPDFDCHVLISADENFRPPPCERFILRRC